MAGAQSMVLGAQQRVPETETLDQLPLVCTTEAQLPYQAHWKKRKFFFFLEFLLISKHAQTGSAAWLALAAGTLLPAMPSPAAPETQAGSALPQGWAIGEDVTSRKGHQIRSCFSV